MDDVLPLLGVVCIFGAHPKVADDDDVIKEESMLFENFFFYSLQFVNVTISAS